MRIADAPTFPSLSQNYNCLDAWDLHRTNTIKVIWRHSSFTGGGRPQVPLHVLFQEQAIFGWIDGLTEGQRPILMSNQPPLRVGVYKNSAKK